VEPLFFITPLPAGLGADDMRLVSYRQNGDWRPAISSGGVVVDATKLLTTLPSFLAGRPIPGSVRGLLEHYADDLPELGDHAADCVAKGGQACVAAEENVRLGPPVPNPRKVFGVGLNYRKHVEETGRTQSEFPNLFAKFGSSLVGPTDELRISSVSEQLDYEGELAIVIGKACRDLPSEYALDYVVGATVLNDITARDLQFHASQWLAGKAVDGSTPCGPALVTLDELGDPHGLTLVTRLNGSEVQRAQTGLMIFTISDIVAYISRFLTLQPGDVIATGTPDGVGSRKDPPTWLQPGDVVEVDVDGIGALRNVVR
jgi:2-keto-4-pentenoate hydratase/2-oxohepta-3-ene-1,7-dioic acid hydratase in catechol pathway